MRYWVSWHHSDEFGEFELHSPWWISGYSDNEETICAAIIAESEQGAKERVYKSYDTRPSTILFRFVDLRPSDWNPFCGRFQRGEWMQWSDNNE